MIYILYHSLCTAGCISYVLPWMLQLVEGAWRVTGYSENEARVCDSPCFRSNHGRDQTASYMYVSGASKLA